MRGGRTAHASRYCIEIYLNPARLISLEAFVYLLMFGSEVNASVNGKRYCLKWGGLFIDTPNAYFLIFRAFKAYSSL